MAAPRIAPDQMPWLTRVAGISSDARDTTELMRDLLAAMTEVTGLESAYVTRLDHETDRLTLLARQTSIPDQALPEDLDIPIADSLCIRSLRDEQFWVEDVHTQWQEVAHLYDDIRTWVSVPIRLSEDERPYGMLCAASPEPISGDDTVRPVLELLARLIGTKLASERDRLRAEHRADTAESLLHQRLEFAAMTEHAMKGPLTIIEGWVSLLLDRGNGLSDDDRRRALASVHAAAERLGMQLEDLVTEARATLVKEAPRPHDISEITRRVVDDFGDHSFSLVVLGEPTVALVDERGLRLVLEHLLENIVSHTPADTPVEVETREEDGWAVLEVRDRGPGIPADVDPFEPFTSGSDGSGLGLWIVQSIVESMGGTVEVSATYPTGATFTCWFRLP